jgi:hypothetical protein
MTVPAVTINRAKLLRGNFTAKADPQPFPEVRGD